MKFLVALVWLGLLSPMAVAGPVVDDSSHIKIAEDFDAWLEDNSVPKEKTLRVKVSLDQQATFSDIGALEAAMAKHKLKFEIIAAEVKPRELTVETDKEAISQLLHNLELRTVTEKVYRIVAASDFGTLEVTLPKITALREAVRLHEKTAKDAYAEILSLLNGEYSLKRELTENDREALAAVYVDTEGYLERLRTEDLLSKVRYGFFINGVRLRNEVQQVKDGEAPPRDTADTVFVKGPTFPTHDGDVHYYLACPRVATATGYVMTARLPKGYRYEKIKSAVFPAHQPQFRLVEPGPAVRQGR